MPLADFDISQADLRTIVGSSTSVGEARKCYRSGPIATFRRTRALSEKPIAPERLFCRFERSGFSPLHLHLPRSANLRSDRAVRAPFPARWLSQVVIAGHEAQQNCRADAQSGVAHDRRRVARRLAFLVLRFGSEQLAYLTTTAHSSIGIVRQLHVRPKPQHRLGSRGEHRFGLQGRASHRQDALHIRHSARNVTAGSMLAARRAGTRQAKAAMAGNTWSEWICGTVRHLCLTIERIGDECMTMLTITAKGQVTLKQDLLQHLGVSRGEKVEADKLPDGRIIVRAATQDGRIADFIGCLSQKRGPRLTIDQMNEIASRGWAKTK